MIGEGRTAGMRCSLPVPVPYGLIAPYAVTGAMVLEASISRLTVETRRMRLRRRIVMLSSTLSSDGISKIGWGI